MSQFHSPPSVCAAVLFAAATATAQGSFVNFEVPQVRPIATAVVGSTEYLLACNTPDHFLEIYDANTATPGTAPTFVTRVPVGQGPASVRWDPVNSCCYTANYIGDSVSKIELTDVGGTLIWEMKTTIAVGEAPSDLAVSADGSTLYVTLADASRLATIDTATMIRRNAPALMTTSSGGFDFAVKEPRRVEVHNGAHWIANMKGGNTFAPHVIPANPLNPMSPVSQPYDLDLWTHDPSTSTTRVMGGLGTQNAGMAFGVDGKLYVVGSMARNEVPDEPALQLMAMAGSSDTGFVESWLWVVDPTGASPTLVTARDLNKSTAGVALAKANACSQPMDVALLSSGGSVTKVYIATFSSDRIIVLTTNAGPATSWTRSRINIDVTPVPSNYGRSGPRGLVINGAQSRLYCLNRLSNSISVIDLSNDTEAVRFSLQSDFTPRLVREGRRFLYSAEFSGNGTVSCSSCHIDGRSDGLGWDLGTPAAGPVVHPIGLDDVIADPQMPDDWKADKGILVTQSLQGLVNHPLNVAGQDFFSNKPYHWRGDREDFKAFNGAFVNLMGGTNLGTPGSPMGLTDAEMTKYRDFINTVMYTPNPEQAHDRVPRGTIGTLDDISDGTGAMRGLKVFHVNPFIRCLGRSCVQCHFGPEGSNNKITEDGTVGGLETAALRSLFQREGRPEEAAGAGMGGQSTIFSAHFGLTRDGHAHNAFAVINVDGPASIDRFVLDSFGQLSGPSGNLPAALDLVQFVREMDAGIAPSVGVTHTATFATRFGTRTTIAFNLLEGQVAKANCGFAVYLQLGGVPHGYYYDLTAATPGYHLHGTATVITRTAMLNLMGANDIIVLQGTPAGSERRVTSLSGFPGTLTGPAPSSISLEPMRPPTQWAAVPQLTKNWDPTDVNPAHQFVPTGVAEPMSIKTVRLLQRGLIQFAPAFGLTALRHEAPRRFAVSGDDIRLGARLHLRVPAPTTPGTPPPYVNVTAETTLLDLPLYPTDQFVDGHRVWESTVEADALLTYTLLMGGPGATGVDAAINDPANFSEPSVGSGLPLQSLYPPNTFEPVTWNQYHVTVVNEDNTSSTGAWMTLTIQ